MKVEVLVGRATVTLPMDAAIRDAVELMARENIGLLVLVDAEEKERMRAVVSERDIIRAIAGGKALDEPLRSVATTDVLTVEADSEVGVAAKIMAQRRIRHLVVTRRGKLAGVISIRDLVGERSTLTAIVKSYEEVEPFPGGD